MSVGHELVERLAQQPASAGARPGWRTPPSRRRARSSRPGRPWRWPDRPRRSRTPPRASAASRTCAVHLGGGRGGDEPGAVEIRGRKRPLDHPHPRAVDGRRDLRRDHRHVGAGGEQRRNLRGGDRRRRPRPRRAARRSGGTPAAAVAPTRPQPWRPGRPDAPAMRRFRGPRRCRPAAIRHRSPPVARPARAAPAPLATGRCGRRPPTSGRPRRGRKRPTPAACRRCWSAGTLPSRQAVSGSRKGSIEEGRVITVSCHRAKKKARKALNAFRAFL